MPVFFLFVFSWPWWINRFIGSELSQSWFSCVTILSAVTSCVDRPVLATWPWAGTALQAAAVHRLLVQPLCNHNPWQSLRFHCNNLLAVTSHRVTADSHGLPDLCIPIVMFNINTLPGCLNNQLTSKALLRLDLWLWRWGSFKTALQRT